MRKPGGMRPQDLLVPLKIVSIKDAHWKTTDLANQLFISQSEISQALQRNLSAGLTDASKRNVHKESLIEFLSHGVKYVFPQRPGEIVRGIPTAHSAAPLSEFFQSETDVYVWQDENGMMRGQKIEPLFPSVTRAVKVDPAFYELVALVDALRRGRPREYRVAIEQLRKRILAK